jgi:hypothetical protein
MADVRTIEGIFFGFEGGWIVYNSVEPYIQAAVVTPTPLLGIVALPIPSFSRLDITAASLSIILDIRGGITPLYRFRLYKGSLAVDAPKPNLDTDIPVLDFYAEIPDLANVDISQLIPDNRDESGLVAITGRIADSAGYWLNGRLDVTLPVPSVRDETTPDTAYTDVTRSFEVKNGLVDILLRESESTRLSYRFQFYQLVGTGDQEYAVDPLLDFYAIIPDAATYEFTSLIPTGVTNDTLATDALRVAKAIFEQPTLINILASALKIYRQSTPPAGASGDVWIKTDGTVWNWNTALSKWESLLQQSPVAAVGASASGAYFAPLKVLPYNDILLKSISLRYNVPTGTNDGSNRWSIRGGYKTSDAAATYPTVTYLSDGTAIATIADQLYTPSPSTALSKSTLEYFILDLVKTGSPGNLNATGTFNYTFLHP